MKYHVIIRETATHSSEWLTVDAESIDDAIAVAIDSCGCERGFGELFGRDEQKHTVGKGEKIA